MQKIHVKILVTDCSQLQAIPCGETEVLDLRAHEQPRNAEVSQDSLPRFTGIHATVWVSIAFFEFDHSAHSKKHERIGGYALALKVERGCI